ncbi:hypothetical protein F5Y04DRAFT_259930 [Hypomontagnella monticulosa]|nr:hypothetical protein F5Y04DRAFT_259930 [Hypomontagnella monticulosa]
MGPLCRFYQQGNCRNGASCRFEHPGANMNPNPNPFGAASSSSNRFSALSTGGNRSQDIPYKITKDSIKIDLADERPSWLLSCYGPGRDAPEQLFGGPTREMSPEEALLYLRGSNNPQQAMSEIAALHQKAEQQNQQALSNLDGAIQFILAAENNHPNRIDICKQTTPAGGTAGVFSRQVADDPPTGFSNPLASNPFSSAPRQSQQPPQNPFGNGAPAFGQPSGMGQKPNAFLSTSNSPPFGQPTAMGAPKPAFGQTSQMGASGPAFGQPSAMGQKLNPFGGGGFGQSQTQTQNPFGQPVQQPSPFAAPATSSAPNPFAAKPSASIPNPFGQPAAANPFAQPASTPSMDQQMDTSAPTPAASNPFGQPSTSSPFAKTGQTNGPPSNPFAAMQKPSGFGAPAAANPFAVMQTQSQAQPQSQAQSASTAAKNPYGPNSTKQHPPAESYIVKALNGRITSFNGQPVYYRWKVDDKYVEGMPQDTTGPRDPPVAGVLNSDGSWRKLFFPDGPPGYNPDTEPANPALYTAAVKDVYAKMMATGVFQGDMPEVPPLREDCLWNF